MLRLNMYKNERLRVMTSRRGSSGRVVLVAPTLCSMLLAGDYVATARLPASCTALVMVC